MNRNLIIAIGIWVVFGCSQEPSTQPNTSEEQAEACKAIRELIPEAASVPWDTVANLTPDKMKTIDNQSLTMVLGLDYRPSQLNGKAAGPETKHLDFRILEQANGPNPSALVAALSKSKDKGYATVIQPEYITNFTCDIKGEMATGMVSFEAKGLYQGRVEYTARRSGGSWRIETFRLPGQIRLTRTADGKWKKSRIGDGG